MTDASRPIGTWFVPPRFLAFLIALIVAVPAGAALLGLRVGVMAGFDVAALAFMITIVPLFDDETNKMRAAARRNDANRVVLLGITGAVTLVILAAIAAELTQKGSPKPLEVVLIVATLAIAWLFSNVVYALHYAHLYYLEEKGDDGSSKDRGGLDFPSDDEPDYWDFIYFAFTLGMTFQTSDVEMSGRAIRRVSIFHCLAAFVFNLGILAFTINVLGGG